MNACNVEFTNNHHVILLLSCFPTAIITCFPHFPHCSSLSRRPVMLWTACCSRVVPKCFAKLFKHVVAAWRRRLFGALRRVADRRTFHGPNTHHWEVISINPKKWYKWFNINMIWLNLLNSVKTSYVVDMGELLCQSLYNKIHSTVVFVYLPVNPQAGHPFEFLKPKIHPWWISSNDRRLANPFKGVPLVANITQVPITF